MDIQMNIFSCLSLLKYGNFNTQFIIKYRKAMPNTTMADSLVMMANEPQYGARPLRRLIARYLREPLADFLLSQKRDGNAAAITVAVQDDKLSFTTVS